MKIRTTIGLLIALGAVAGFVFWQRPSVGDESLPASDAAGSPPGVALELVGVAPARAAQSKPAMAASSQLPPPAPTADMTRTIRVLEAGAACKRAAGLAEVVRVSENNHNVPPEEVLTNMHNAEAKCRSEPAANTANLDDLLISAASAGNTKAAACYASRALVPRTHDGPQAPADSRYLHLLPGLIDRGINAGEWRMVVLAASINYPRRAGDPYLSLPPPDAKLAYRYTKLMELGATGDEKLDLQLVSMGMAQDLSPDDRYEAEKAAEKAFAEHFSASGPLKQESLTLCQDF